MTVVTLVLCCSCSKERSEPKNDKKQYGQMNNYLDSKKQQEQVYEINSSGDGPLVGNQGSKIWGSKDNLMYPNGDSVQWPFTIKLVELYTPKDMIYWQMPTVSDGILLTTGGEIRIRAFKDDQELVLRPGKIWTIEMPNSAPLDSMQIYYGVENSSFVDWINNPVGNFNITTYGYSGEIEKLGWVACGKLAFHDVSTASTTFFSSKDDLSNISIFIYMPHLKGLMQVYDQTSAILPQGEEAKIIAMGIDGNQQLYYYYQDSLVKSNDHIEVTLDSTSDGALTTLLNSL